MSRRAGVIVLVGPMGVGKTTIGRKLAKALDKNFVDTDALITERHGDIPSIFLEQGEEQFRRLEEVALSDALRNPSVVATGGGVVLSARNRKRLKRASVIYLSTSGRHINSRLRGSNRPLLKAGADWQQIYDARKPLYEAVADVTVDASSRPLKVVIGEILEWLGD